jgi:hypothetical protein
MRYLERWEWPKSEADAVRKWLKIALNLLKTNDHSNVCKRFLITSVPISILTETLARHNRYNLV